MTDKHLRLMAGNDVVAMAMLNSELVFVEVKSHYEFLQHQSFGRV